MTQNITLPKTSLKLMAVSDPILFEHIMRQLGFNVVRKNTDPTIINIQAESVVAIASAITEDVNENTELDQYRTIAKKIAEDCGYIVMIKEMSDDISNDSIPDINLNVTKRWLHRPDNDPAWYLWYVGDGVCRRERGYNQPLPQGGKWRRPTFDEIVLCLSSKNASIPDYGEEDEDIVAEATNIQRQTPELDPSVDLTKRVFTIIDASKLLRVSAKTVKRWYEYGHLKGYRLPGTEDYRFPREHFERFLLQYGFQNVLNKLKEAQTASTTPKADPYQNKVISDLNAVRTAISQAITSNREWGRLGEEAILELTEARNQIDHVLSLANNVK